VKHINDHSHILNTFALASVKAFAMLYMDELNNKHDKIGSRQQAITNIRSSTDSRNVVGSVATVSNNHITNYARYHSISQRGCWAIFFLTVTTTPKKR